MEKFEDRRLTALNDDPRLVDKGMRSALIGALLPGESALASYNVSAHIWLEAVLTDQALLLVKGAVRAQVLRVPFPLDIVRSSTPSRSGVRVRTALGTKTFWGSKNDPAGELLMLKGSEDAFATASTYDTSPALSEAVPSDSEPTGLSDEANVAEREPRKQKRRSWLARRRAGGPKPRRPRRRRVRKARVGFAPPQTVWDMASDCVKCGRPLTDPRSRQARVGTKCIRIYGSQARRIPNPQHTIWSNNKLKAEIDYIAEKAAADAEFDRAIADYERALDTWSRARMEASSTA